MKQYESSFHYFSANEPSNGINMRDNDDDEEDDDVDDDDDDDSEPPLKQQKT